MWILRYSSGIENSTLGYVPKCVPKKSSLTIVEPYGYNEYIEVTVLMSPWKGDLENLEEPYSYGYPM